MGNLGLGTVQFGLNYGNYNLYGKTSLKESRNILNFAKENNIETVDTSSAYGDSEKILGKIGVNNFNVVTKTVSLSLGSVTNVIESFYQSLNDLKIVGNLNNSMQQLS